MNMKLWGNSGILLDTQKETTEIIKVLDEYMTRHSDDVPESIISLWNKVGIINFELSQEIDGSLEESNRNMLKRIQSEAISQRKDAKRMLLANEPLERIALLTGLSLEEVKQEEKIVKSLLEKMDPVEVYDCLLL
jgi:ribosome-binding ATPase YchF (GTP1/OBG family)